MMTLFVEWSLLLILGLILSSGYGVDNYQDKGSKCHLVAFFQEGTKAQLLEVKASAAKMGFMSTVIWSREDMMDTQNLQDKNQKWYHLYHAQIYRISVTGANEKAKHLLYALFKPIIILDAMKRIPRHEWIIFSDIVNYQFHPLIISPRFFTKSASTLQQLAMTNDQYQCLCIPGIITATATVAASSYTIGFEYRKQHGKLQQSSSHMAKVHISDALTSLDMVGNCQNSIRWDSDYYMVDTSFSVWHNDFSTEMFVTNWLHIMLYTNLLQEVPFLSADATVMSLLLAKHHVRALWLPQYTPFHTTTFVTTPQKKYHTSSTTTMSTTKLSAKNAHHVGSLTSTSTSSSSSSSVIEWTTLLQAGYLSEIHNSTVISKQRSHHSGASNHHLIHSTHVTTDESILHNIFTNHSLVHLHPCIFDLCGHETGLNSALPTNAMFASQYLDNSTNSDPNNYLSPHYSSNKKQNNYTQMHQSELPLYQKHPASTVKTDNVATKKHFRVALCLIGNAGFTSSRMADAWQRHVLNVLASPSSYPDQANSKVTYTENIVDVFAVSPTWPLAFFSLPTGSSSSQTIAMKAYINRFPTLLAVLYHFLAQLKHKRATEESSTESTQFAETMKFLTQIVEYLEDNELDQELSFSAQAFQEYEQILSRYYCEYLIHQHEQQQMHEYDFVGVGALDILWLMNHPKLEELFPLGTDGKIVDTKHHDNRDSETLEHHTATVPNSSSASSNSTSGDCWSLAKTSYGYIICHRQAATSIMSGLITNGLLSAKPSTDWTTTAYSSKISIPKADLLTVSFLLTESLMQDHFELRTFVVESTVAAEATVISTADNSTLSITTDNVNHDNFTISATTTVTNDKEENDQENDQEGKEEKDELLNKKRELIYFTVPPCREKTPLFVISKRQFGPPSHNKRNVTNHDHHSSRHHHPYYYKLENNYLQHTLSSRCWLN